MVSHVSLPQYQKMRIHLFSTERAITRFYPNGKLLEEGAINDSLPQGLWIFTLVQAQKEEGTFTNELKDRHLDFMVSKWQQA